MVVPLRLLAMLRLIPVVLLLHLATMARSPVLTQAAQSALTLLLVQVRASLLTAGRLQVPVLHSLPVMQERIQL
jgi:hypothetical protein